MTNKPKGKRKKHATRTPERPTKPQNPLCLLGLPAELRLIIYDKIKSDIEDRAQRTASFRPPELGLGLLWTCKLIRHEYLPVWHSIDCRRIHTLQLYSFDFKLKPALAALRDLLAHPTLKPAVVEMCVWLYRVRPAMAREIKAWMAFWAGFQPDRHTWAGVQRRYVVHLDEKALGLELRREVVDEVGLLESLQQFPSVSPDLFASVVNIGRAMLPQLSANVDARLLLRACGKSYSRECQAGFQLQQKPMAIGKSEAVGWTRVASISATTSEAE
ncbi:hypothetical protein EJ03DRAFT_332903 [Teratosphaeria nubilosa]|uniref:F-box domain-containing protein n=1 Tax=Teratosphaeria nubilosa TaxID=161662 RepID=A0A6G1LPY6_9PEZI|nr:hypothetical protein EJ03DRAFT_332903 [Teratosphaeria nubilosa]